MIQDFYDLARGLHIIAVIAWMAGLMMLPRFYAYQTEAEPGGELEKKMIEASGKLRTIVLNPAMIAAWALGLYLLIAFHRDHLLSFWLIGKLTIVIVISGIHGFYISEGKKLARGERPRSSRFWRALNEIPFLLAIAAILLVTLQPT